MITPTAATFRYAFAIVLASALVVRGGTRADAAEKRDLCEPNGTVRVGVELKPPAGKTLAGVVIAVAYPEHAVKIPGSADQPVVTARLSGVPEGFLASPNDLDDALVVALAGTRALPPGVIFTVELDRCKDAPRAEAKDFGCKVEQASSEAGVLVAGSTCTVRMVGDTVEKAKEGSL